MGEQVAAYIYEPFAQTKEYITINETIVRRWVDAMIEAGSRQMERILDLATGVGTMVQLFLENLPGQARPVEVVCVDQNGQALKQAEHNLSGQVKSLKMIQSPLQELSLEPDSADVAIWGNGVHYLNENDQREAFSRIRRVLRPGGWFFFNSAFYEESRPESTLGFYRSQVARAVRSLRERGITRDKTEAHPESANFLPLSHYRDLLQQAGFKVEEMKKFVARLYQFAWEKISGFSQYAAGALHGYPAEDAARALQEAVAPSLEEYGVRDEKNELYIPRNWLSAIARAT